MSITLEKLAELTNSNIQGDKNCQITDVAALDAATDTQISFVSNPKYKKELNTTEAKAVILSPVLAKSYSGNALVNDDPYLTFAKIVSIFHLEKKVETSIHPSAVIAKSATITKNVSISPNVVIEDNVVINEGVTIGAGCFIGNGSILEKGVFLHSNVTLYSKTKIGTDSIVHSGAVIGSDGFGFAIQKDRSWYKILQIGNVVIGSDVEIGANTTIDRAALGSTIIGNGTKLDNQIQIAHNVKIGEHTVLAGGTLIAGSTTIGDYCQFGGAVAMAGHLTIADNVIFTGRSMVMKSVDTAGVYSSGVVAEENKKWRRNAVRFSQLDEMAKTIKTLEKQVALLSEQSINEPPKK